MLAHIQYTQRHTRAHTHTEVHTFTLTHTHTEVHTHTQTHTQRYTQRHAHTHTHTCWLVFNIRSCFSVYPYTYLPSPPRDTQHVSAASKACQQHLSVPASLCICIRISVYIPPLPSSGHVARGEPRDIRVCVVLCGSCCPSAPSASTVKHVSS